MNDDVTVIVTAPQPVIVQPVVAPDPVIIETLTQGLPGIQGVSVVGASINSSGHLILTLSNGDTIDAGLLPTQVTQWFFGTDFPLSTPTECGLVKYTSDGQFSDFVIRQPYTGLAFDGASTTAHPPILSNNNLTATWAVTSASMASLVVSSGTLTSGKWYVHYFIAYPQSIIGGLVLGLAGPSINVNTPTNPNGNICAALATQVGPFAFNNSLSALNSTPAANLQEFIVYVDVTNSTWGIVTPDNVNHANLQSAVGMPTGALTLLAGVNGSIASGSQNFSITATTGYGSLTPPAGYANAIG